MDVFGMCNALLDVQATIEHEDLERLGLRAGGMYLIDEERRGALLEIVHDRIVNTAAGGSGANTMIGIARLGGSASFTSRVGTDDAGEAYASSLADAGVLAILRRGSGATGLSVILLTPDMQRTMCTYLGEARRLDASDVREDALREARVLYITGYLWDTEPQQRAVRRAIEIARDAGARVALSLSDLFCVERHLADFRELLASSVDIVFGNEDEALAATGALDAEKAARSLGQGDRLAFVTLGARGACVGGGGSVQHVDAEPVTVVDTTGAGDAYAAGVLYGLCHGSDPLESARVGARLAAQVVASLGPRPPATPSGQGIPPS